MSKVKGGYFPRWEFFELVIVHDRNCSGVVFSKVGIVHGISFPVGNILRMGMVPVEIVQGAWNRSC